MIALSTATRARRVLLSLTWLVATLVVAALASSTVVAQEAPFADGRLIVKPRKQAVRAYAAKALVQPHGQAGAVASVAERMPTVGVEVWALEGVTVEEALRLYAGDPRFEFVEPDYRVQPTLAEAPVAFPLAAPARRLMAAAAAGAPNDPRFDEQYGLYNTGQAGGTPGADIDALGAWSSGSDCAVPIAVIDTGIDHTHPDLADNLWINAAEDRNGNGRFDPDSASVGGDLDGVDADGNGYADDVIGYDFWDDDADPMDEKGHGTHVAGVLAAVGDNGIGTAGICQTARVMALRFIGPNGGYISGAIRALEYAVANGATISNNSWGGKGFSSSLYAAVEAARDAGHLFVAAAGNDGMDNDANPHYPSGFALDNVVAVAASDRDDVLATFPGGNASNYGATTVDLTAPGLEILAPVLGGGYGVKSGTSMAAPLVAGTAGLVWTQNPSLDARLVRDRILSGSEGVPGLSGVVATDGRNNARAASAATTLPVELTAFEAIVDGGAVVLRWATAQERGNLGFDVERVREGRPERLAFVPGAGTTDAAQAYEHRLSADRLGPGRQTFRLRQVDADGGATYSPEVTVEVPVPEALVLTAAYPNPFNPRTAFTLAARQRQHVEVAVYDALGRHVAALFAGPVEAGEAVALSFDAAHLPSGVYLVRAAGETFVSTQRVTLVK